MSSRAWVADWADSSENQRIANVFAVFGGVALLSLLAQVVIPVPWSPVPITGQTFGVSLVSLCWGTRRGLAAILGYLALGSFGLPVFAAGMSGFLLGPTFGYLVGMAAAILVVSQLVEKGFAKGFYSTLVCLYVGSFLIFSFGLVGLSFFLPRHELLMAGLLPFVFGDLLKNIAATTVYMKLSQQKKA